MVKIIIADDNALVRKGLKQIVSETRDMVLSDEASNGEELIQKVSRNEYDVVVLDISMPGSNVLENLRKIKQLRPDLAVLILTVHPEKEYAVRLFKAGVAGYLTKESAPEELLQAIRRVSSGRRYLSISFSRKLAHTLITDHTEEPHETLSDREFQVFCLIASGKRCKEIANLLCLSEKTISTYRSRVLQKMNLKNNSELMHYAFEYGLME